jgi:hypothetical protein
MYRFSSALPPSSPLKLNVHRERLHTSSALHVLGTRATVTDDTFSNPVSSCEDSPAVLSLGFRVNLNKLPVKYATSVMRSVLTRSDTLSWARVKLVSGFTSVMFALQERTQHPSQ